MQAHRPFTLALFLGLAGCATPAQVRRVETQVAVLDRDHARADSARGAEFARVAEAQRRNMDTVNVLMAQLNDAIQRMSRDNAANFDNLMKQLYAVSNLASNTQQSVKRLSGQVETAVSSGPPVAVNSVDSVGHAVVPTTNPATAEAMLDEASRQIDNSAFGGARATLNRMMSTYPNAPEIGDALYQMGYSFDIGSPPQPDSARVYYNRVYASYPASQHVATALFKLGNLELKAGNIPAARHAWQLIVDKYKDRDEYGSAQQRLRDNP